MITGSKVLLRFQVAFHAILVTRSESYNTWIDCYQILNLTKKCIKHEDQAIHNQVYHQFSDRVRRRYTSQEALSEIRHNKTTIYNWKAKYSG